MLPNRIQKAAGIAPQATEISGIETTLESEAAVQYVPHEVVHAEPAVPCSQEDIRPLADIEQETIEGAIALCGGDITQASKRLGIARATIYRKLKEWRRAARTAAPAVAD